jgi:hypothetical protein
MIIPVGEDSNYVNLGDWIGYFTYGVFDGLNFFENFEKKIITVCLSRINSYFVRSQNIF